MEQHPIPRQITTFEFKLIGFMTLKQFLYLLVFIPAGYLVYHLIPIPFVNFFLALVVGIFGVALAFFPIQDRPLDVWLKNLFKRMRSATQYTYQRENEPLYFLKDLYYDSDPHKIMAHLESQKKLEAYLSQNNKNQTANSAEKSQIDALLKKAVPSDGAQPVTPPTQTEKVSEEKSTPQLTKYDLKKIESTYSLKQPFFTGVVKNNKQIPLPGVMIYVKDEEDSVVRLLKTNPHGVFASYSPLPPGSYNMEIKDPNEGYFFDTMKIRIETQNPTPFIVYSKELL